MVSRMREMWPGNGDEQNDLLNLVQRNRMSMVITTSLISKFTFSNLEMHFQLQNDDVTGSNLMDMMHDEAMLEQLAAAKSYPRKMINNIDVANLLKQVQSNASQHHHKLASPSSAHSISPRSSSPHSSAQHILLQQPVAPSTSSAIEPSK